MKKLLLLLLFVSIFGFTQTNINELSKQQAKEFSDKIAITADTHYQFFKENFSNKHQVYYYIPTNLTGNELTESKTFNCDKCLKVIFEIVQNKPKNNINLPGITTYKFSRVTGKFLDIFPTWQREFKQTATKTNVLNYKDRIAKNTKLGLDVRITKNQDIWKIYNWSF